MTTLSQSRHPGDYNRRTFLRAAGLATATLTLAPLYRLGVGASTLATAQTIRRFDGRADRRPNLRRRGPTVAAPRRSSTVWPRGRSPRRSG